MALLLECLVVLLLLVWVPLDRLGVAPLDLWALRLAVRLAEARRRRLE